MLEYQDFIQDTKQTDENTETPVVIHLRKVLNKNQCSNNCMQRHMTQCIRNQITRNYHIVDILTSLRAPIRIGTNDKVVGDITCNSTGK
jgi:hypothetical protein